MERATVKRTVAMGRHAFDLFLVLAIFSCASLHAQVAGGTIQGTILDTSGGAIPRVQVAIKNVATNVVTQVQTNDDGFYTAPNLLPGEYEITASAPGFATAVAKEVDLSVGAQLQVNLALKAGPVTETVVVSTATPPVDLASSTLSAVVDETTVRELPLNGRDWTQLATLETGVAAIHTQVGLSTGPDRGNRGFGSQVTISGGRPAQNNYRLDGVSINDYSNGAPGSVLGSNLGVDAVEEFSVLTSNYSAEYGRTSGGVINAVTKSGTNTFHGTAYEFLRNSALDARNFFDFDPLTGSATKAPFRRNQFGASAGGPIRKDKTFIFGDYEGDRQATSISQPITVPTNNAWNGLVDGPVKPEIFAFRSFFPVLDDKCNTATTACPDSGSTTSVVNQVIHENYFTIRGDHRPTSKDKLVGTYVYDKAAETQPDIFNTVLTGNSTKRQIVTAEDTHVITPTIINTIRFGFNRVAAFSGQNATPINSLSGDTSGKFSAVPGRPAPGINIGGGIAGFGGGLGASPVYRFHWNSFQLYDDAFATKGIHFIKFGFATEYIQDNILASSDASGVVRFGNLTNFFSNVPGKFDAALPGGITERQIRQHVYAGYVQDDIRFRPNLTFNAGVRYEMSTVPTDVHGQLSTLINPTDPAPPAPHLGNPYFLNPTYHNFEPRVGFAWDPFRTGKTSVRGGFGMFDVLPLPYLYELLVPLAAPFFELGTNSNLNGFFFPNCGVPSAPTPCNSIINAVNQPANLRQSYIEHNPKRNYAMQWNLNVQREIVKDVTGMVAYVGSRAVHQAFRADDINTTVPQTPLNAAGPIYSGVDVFGNALGTPLNGSVGQISTVTWGGDAHYHALQAKLTARAGSKFQSQLSYTWGKSIDTGSSTVGGDTFLNSISSLPYFNPALRRGPSDFNITHNVVISYNWKLPSPKRLPAVLNSVVGGWQLGGVAQLSSGIPFTVNIDPNSDPLGLGSTDTWDFPDRVNSPNCQSLVNPGNVSAYFKSECFTIPAAPASFASMCSQQTLPQSQTTFVPPPPGQITCTNRRGNLGRNSLVGPRLKNFDFSLFKNIPVKRVSETFSIQFRTEMFNIFNHANFAPPLNHLTVYTQHAARSTQNPNGDATQLDNVTGGQLDSTVTNSRQIQFGLKFVW
jgi:hypothetical protein